MMKNFYQNLKKLLTFDLLDDIFIEEEIENMNSMLVIFPYYSGTWCFDDMTVGLLREPFVMGIPEIIDDMLVIAKIKKKDARDGFRLIFSAKVFPGYHMKLTWVREESGGNWYTNGAKEGWLCPALFKYFKKAPKEIYARAESA